VTAVVLVLAHAADAGAAAVAAWLARESGPQAVRIVRPEALSLSRWSQRVDARGRASTRIVPSRAPPLASAEVGAVLNRIRYLPAPRFHRASGKDQEYAGAELQAVVASWLAELGDRVVHAVRRHPWVTPLLPLQHWARAAAACGLPVAARTLANSPRAYGSRGGRSDFPNAADDHIAGIGMIAAGTVVVAGNEVGGALSARYGPSALAAARALEFPLLEFRFAIEKNETVLVEVDPLPPLAEPWAAALVGRLLAALAREPRQ
jgi:hypothetical protein